MIRGYRKVRIAVICLPKLNGRDVYRVLYNIRQSIAVYMVSAKTTQVGC
jgi:hypothetical protein